MRPSGTVIDDKQSRPVSALDQVDKTRKAPRDLDPFRDIALQCILQDMLLLGRAKQTRRPDERSARQNIPHNAAYH